MAARITHLLRILYYQHGLFTFLLLFVPTLPGMVEWHTHAYLKFLKLYGFDVRSAHEGIKLLFGDRGVKAYHRFLVAHQELVMPDRIFNVLYQQSDVDQALLLIQALFTDPLQRSFPRSYLFRSTLYQEIPQMLAAFRDQQHRSFHHRLIDLFLHSVALEQAPQAQMAASQTIHRLVELAHFHIRRQQQLLQDQQAALMTARLKASLVPSHSIYTAPLNSPVSTRNQGFYLDPDQLRQLQAALAKLAAKATHEFAPEIQSTYSRIGRLHPQLAN